MHSPLRSQIECVAARQCAVTNEFSSCGLKVVGSSVFPLVSYTVKPSRDPVIGFRLADPRAGISEYVAAKQCAMVNIILQLWS